MESYTYLPKYPLSLFVDCFWYLEDWDLTHPRERILPTGNLELIFNVNDSQFSPRTNIDINQRKRSNLSLVKGIYSEFSDIDTRLRACLLGVEFKPGGSYPFFAFPSDQFHNLQVPLIDLWKDDTPYLEYKLLNAPSIEECFLILEKFLASKIINDRRLNPAVAFALAKFQEKANTDKVSQVVEQTGYSSRHFIKLFREQVGLPPKLFFRLQRFQHSINRMVKIHEPRWAELAVESGFYDQSHFINEFGYFAGLTPAMYLRNLKFNPNHLALAAKR